ncbi:MAG: rRNA maturation RNase YbeY [Ruminococcaceae bacterium]|nr:rRNA maturation RNase YbeY [Oscillospiraceae bacterium]
MRLTVYYENEQSTYPVTYKLKMLIRRAIQETLAYEQYENDAEVSVTLTDGEGIQDLNLRFRGIDAPTDVLSFPLFDFEGETDEPPVDDIQNMLGDIVLNLERTQAQAEEFGHSFEREAAFLTVHSMLHLLGYDHETGEEDEADMRARQRDVMERMGLTVQQPSDKQED